MRVRKLQVYKKSGQEPQPPGLAMDTAQHPFSQPSVCPAPHFSGVLGSRLWYYWALDTAVCLQVCVRCGVFLMTCYNSGKWTERLGLIWLQGAEAIGPRARGQPRASEEGAQRIS